MKTILVRDYPNFAGKWIYDGYAAAWNALGYQVERWVSLNGVDLAGKHLMLTSSDIIVKNDFIDDFIDYLSVAERVYIFVSPTKFPEPWCNHANFVDQTAKKPYLVQKLKELPNVVFWTFCNVLAAPQYWEEWGTVHYVPLAFDNFNYERVFDLNFEYDVCYIGTNADNGFNSKFKIMKEYFSAFKDSNLKCGFFINKNLTHEQECKLLTNSKVCINIHDDYQQKLRLDTNERTWKSLGLNGILVSDYVGPVIPDFVYQCSSPLEMVQKVQELLEKDDLGIKEANSNYVMKNHTYINRCKQLESL